LVLKKQASLELWVALRQLGVQKQIRTDSPDPGGKSEQVIAFYSTN
jgi:hypothetical protein